jgi:uncharacterized protein
MRFVDASVFVHAYLKPRRTLTQQEIQIRKDARNIVSRLNEGEPGIISVIHFSEIANLLEANLPLQEALEIERALSLRSSIEIETVEMKDCLEALDEAAQKEIGFTDALAYTLMRKKQVIEIYSFDHDFDNLPDIKRIRK